MSPYLRTVKTSSGATAVQIVHSSHRGSRDIEHLGSAHTAAEVELLLKAAARQKLAAGQGELDLGLQSGAPGGPLPIISSVMGCLVDALAHAYEVLGFRAATGGDEVFFQLVAARIIEPVSKLDSLRVLEEAGLAPPPYRTVTRRLRAFAREPWRQQISAACAAHARLGPPSLVLYDCSTLYFETDQGDGFREPGFSKQRRLEPQITIGLLTGSDGFPLMVAAFEGNRAETKTMLPVIQAFMAAHGLPDVTVVRELLRIDSDLLAHASVLLGDLGHDQAARNYGNAALAGMQEAETSQAKACYALAKTARWQHKYAEAADLALLGLEDGTVSPMSVQLAYTRPTPQR